MTRLEKEDMKVRILRLASLRSTGKPSELASKMGISERTIKRIIREIRNDGTDIWFHQGSGSYVTSEKKYNY